MTQNEVNKLICIGWDLDKFFTVKTKKVFTGYGWRGKNDEIITISLEDAMNNEIETADLEKKYKVVRKEEKFNDIPILAESEEDFHFILEREAKRLNVPIETVAEHQSEPVRKMWRERKNIYKNDGLELSPEFIEYQMRIDGFLDYCKKVAELAPSEIPEDEILKPEVKLKMQGLISYLDKAIPVLEKLEEKVKTASNENIQSTDNKAKISKLSELICSEKSDSIVESIKVQYRNIGGKRLKLLLMAFQELNLIPKERTASKFHTLCKKEFDWEICSYQAMQDCKYNERVDEAELSEMKRFIEGIIKQ